MKNLILLLLAVVIAYAPFLFISDSEFTGTDAQISEKIEGIAEPWAEPVFTPSGEAESALFALQAALGAGTFCYILGRSQRKAAEK